MFIVVRIILDIAKAPLSPQTQTFCNSYGGRELARSIAVGPPLLIVLIVYDKN